MEREYRYLIFKLTDTKAALNEAAAALSGVRVPVDELRIVTEFFGERNWPDTKVGNAAYALHGRLLAAAKADRGQNET